MRKSLIWVAFAALIVGSTTPAANAQLFRRNRVYYQTYPSDTTTYVASAAPQAATTPPVAVVAMPSGYNAYYPGGAGYEPQFHAPYAYPMFFGYPATLPPSTATYYPGGASYEPQLQYNYPSYRNR